MVIRSIVYKDGEMKIGARRHHAFERPTFEEWDEVELKARRIVETVAEIERTFGVKNTRRRER